MGFICCCLIGLATPGEPYGDEITLEEFTRQYRLALPKVQSVYISLYIQESKRFPGKPPEKTQWTAGGVCGEHVKQTSRIGTSPEHSAPILLTRNSLLEVHFSSSTQNWVLDMYRPNLDQQTYDFQRGFLSRHFPDAFYLYYMDVNKWASVNNVLDGKSSSERIPGDNRITIQKIETVRSGKYRAYRLHYTLYITTSGDTNPVENRGNPGYFDVVPELSWVVVGGRQAYDWEIEYGEAIDGVPIMKHMRIFQYDQDDKTQKFVKVSAGEVIVHKAEKYLAVNPEEFTPQFYGLPATLPDLPKLKGGQRAETPVVVYVIAIALACLIVGLVLVVRGQRWARRSGKATPAGNEVEGGLPVG